MRVMAAFSSDSREQYKADIFKVLSLPKGDVIHFRYKKKYVEACIYQQRQAIVGSDVFIYFSQGNTMNENKKLIHKSIRKAKIISFDWSDMTELYHVRMILGDFINAEICNQGDDGHFLKYIECNDSDYYSNWKSRVEEVRCAFPDMMFFSIDGILDSLGRRVIPKYNPQSKGCFYEVYHGDRYTINIKVANLDGASKKLLINCSPDDVVIAHCNPIESSVDYDDIYIPLNIKTLPFFKHSNFLSYKVINVESDGTSGNSNGEIKGGGVGKNVDFDMYTVAQELCLRLNLKSAIMFGLLCLMAFLAMVFVSDKNTMIVWPYIKIGMSAILIFISTTGLFYFFNKK